MSTRKILIGVAPVGPPIPENVTNPLSPEEVAEATIACAEVGAGMVHLHVRDAHGEQIANTSHYSHTLDQIRDQSDIIIQGSTGGVSDLSLEDRCTALNDPRTEVASLNMGSANFEESVYINTLPDIRYWATRMADTQTAPELEIFEAGMINNVRILREEGIIPDPTYYAFALGFRGAMPASADNLHFLKNSIPSDAPWGLIHHHMEDLTVLAAAIGLGATFVRVGFEDSIYYAPGKSSHSNADLVKRIANLITQMGLGIATPTEAREMLGLPPLT